METVNRLKQSRSASFIIILLVYIIAAAVGIYTYLSLRFEWWLNLLIADVAATVVTFIFSLIFDNASVYDPYWSVQPIVIILAYAAGAELTVGRMLLIAVICLWGIRLTANWAYTFHGLEHQDWRYTMLSVQTGKFYPLINFTGIHLVPTLIVYGCVLPGAYAFIHDAQWSSLATGFCMLSLCAMIMQGTADIQMHRFRKNRTDTFNRTGLWRYSRHPNYLGEILMWWGVALAVVSVFPDAWHLCTGAAANTLLFLIVSIPMADKRQSRKAGYEEYASQTRMLLPVKRFTER